MEVETIERKIQLKREELALAQGAYEKAKLDYEDSTGVYNADKNNIRALLMGLLNVVYIPGIIISDAGLLVSSLATLPVELIGFAISDRIVKRIDEDNYMKIFRAGEKMTKALEKKSAIERSIYNLGKQLEEGDSIKESLPNDGFDLSETPEPVLMAEEDGQRKKIHR